MDICCRGQVQMRRLRIDLAPRRIMLRSLPGSLKAGSDLKSIANVPFKRITVSRLTAGVHAHWMMAVGGMESWN